MDKTVADELRLIARALLADAQTATQTDGRPSPRVLALGIAVGAVTAAADRWTADETDAPDPPLAPY